MDSLQQIVEGQSLANRHDELAVQYEFLRLELEAGSNYIGEITSEWLAGFRLEMHRIAVAKREATKPVPLGLVLPAFSVGNLVDGTGLHRLIRRRDWQGTGFGSRFH